MSRPRLLGPVLASAWLLTPAAAGAQSGGGPDPGVTVAPGNQEYSIPYQSQRSEAAPAKKPTTTHGAAKPRPVAAAKRTYVPQASAPATASPQTSVTTVAHARRSHHRAHRRHRHRHTSVAAAPRRLAAGPARATVPAAAESSGAPGALVGGIVAGIVLVGAGVGLALRRRLGGAAQRDQPA